MSKIIVIGSGFGGLASAIRLQAAGHKVTILESRDQPGGRAYVYREEGYTFDAGPTVITAPDLLTDLFALANRKARDYFELLPVAPFYKLFWEDGTTFDYGGDLDETLAQIEKLSPPDVAGYRKFLNYSKKVYNEGYVKLAAEPFLRFWDMVKVAPQLAALRADRSVYATVSRFIKNPHLREAFSFHSLLVGGNPFATSSIYTLIHYLERSGGVFFPRGGTGALVRAMVRLFEELGGEIRLNTAVDEILTESGMVTGVRLRDQSAIEADAVMSNADVVHTYQHLLRREPRVLERGETLAAKKHSMSLFLIYFGASKKFPDIEHHNVLFGKRYEPLLKEIFGGPSLPEDFSLYLHAPSKTDPSLAPPGHESFYVLSPVGHLGNLAVDWKVEGPRYAKKILDYLDKRYLPGLNESLTVQKIFTPADFKTELNAHHGSAFSLEPILRQSAYFRTHNRDPDLRGLYFVGAGTHPGAGVPGVLSSAKATCKLVLEDFPLREAEHV